MAHGIPEFGYVEFHVSVSLQAKRAPMTLDLLEECANGFEMGLSLFLQHAVGRIPVLGALRSKSQISSGVRWGDPITQQKEGLTVRY